METLSTFIFYYGNETSTGVKFKIDSNMFMHVKFSQTPLTDSEAMHLVILHFLLFAFIIFFNFHQNQNNIMFLHI